MIDLYELLTRLHSLIYFRDVFNDPVLGRLVRLIKTMPDGDPLTAVDAYADFTSHLFAYGDNLSDYVLDYTVNYENSYLLGRAKGKGHEAAMEKSMANDLATMQALAEVASNRFKDEISYSGFLPGWINTQYDFEAEYRKYIANIHTHGYGMYAKHHIFIMEDAIRPVKHPDGIRLADLTGYACERNCVIANTLALLGGKPAANMLLYGDSGTGKSSTIKAVANEYAPRGLRLVEIGKSRLHQLAQLIEALADNPLKFILFIDDLSFTQDDDGFSLLKATLEGSALARTDNIAIYATSNRRHLVKETFSDREGDDIHVNETIQQITSLNDRFGLAVNFTTPGKQAYLEIVAHIAKIYNVQLEPDELSRRAEVFALHKGGRSPRTARQFVEQLVTGVE